MDGQEKTGKQELVEIYDNLLPPLKKQILGIAKIVEDTQEILIDEYKNTEIKPCKNKKLK